MSEDIVVVLAFGVNRDGTLPEEAKLRVAKGVEVFNRDGCKAMLMTARYPARCTYIPEKTESQAMKDYAVELGVPARKIIRETRSRDTVGNAYFSKLILKRTKYRSMVVVTSDYHVNRARFIFKKIYGGAYKLRFAGVKTGYPAEKKDKVRKGEEYALKLVKRDYGNIKDGDDRQIRHVIYTKHKVYAKSLKTDERRQAEFAELDRLRMEQQSPV